MESLDWIVVAGYFALLGLIAWWVIRQSKETADDYFLAGRHLGWFVVGASIFVFNLDQIDDIVTPEMAAIKTSFEPIAKAEAILQGYAGGPEINHQGNRGTYYPERDVIEIAPPEHFITPEQYYATVFHECAHSTGHKKRLKRGIEEKGAPKGSDSYNKEELVAEMASAYLCAIAGIGPATIDNAAAYIKGWSRSLRQDKKLFITAAGQAQKAADLILGTTFEAKSKPTPPAHSLTPKREEIPIEAKSQLDLF